MNKETTIEQVREAARITQEMGMQAGFFILRGYPEETTSDIRMTIDFLKETLRKGHASTQHIPACSRVAS